MENKQLNMVPVNFKDLKPGETGYRFAIVGNYIESYTKIDDEYYINESGRKCYVSLKSYEIFYRSVDAARMARFLSRRSCYYKDIEKLNEKINYNQNNIQKLEREFNDLIVKYPEELI